ncbi:uncharacterized protein ACBT44_015792 isoform 2-T2 [Syngnathus typhle]
MLNCSCCPFTSENKKCWSRQSQSVQQMSDNPIYGNVSCMQTSATAISEINPSRLTVSSSSLHDPLSPSPDSQPRSPDCYANLDLKSSKNKSACSSPLVEYSAVFQSDALGEKDKKNAHSDTTVMDVYASVQTKRTKTGDNADIAQYYANRV